MYRLPSLAIMSVAVTMSVAQVADKPGNAHPLGVGAKVPDAALMTAKGGKTTLKKILGGKPTVLIFYRGDWCPYCNSHLAEMNKIEGDLTRLGYQIVALTPDLPQEITKTVGRQKLDYSIYSDSKADALKKFGVAFRLDDGTFGMYKSKYNVDLERSSGQMHHILPVPSLFVINKAGVITFAHSNPDYQVRMSGEDVLKAAKVGM